MLTLKEHLLWSVAHPSREDTNVATQRRLVPYEWQHRRLGPAMSEWHAVERTEVQRSLHYAILGGLEA